MIKKIILLAGFVLLANMNTNAKLLSFTNGAIHSLDGIPYMIDGVAIHDMLIVIKKSKRIHQGRKVGTKMVGNYKFKDQKLSIKQLVSLEKNNPSNKEIAVLLKKSKHDFIEITKDFVDGIDTAKKLIIELMNEFCDKRNKPKSRIMSWANATHGNEEEIFDTTIKTFEDFDIFMEDLILFLKDLINSCPKARVQYSEWYKKQRQLKGQ